MATPNLFVWPHLHVPMEGVRVSVTGQWARDQNGRLFCEINGKHSINNARTILTIRRFIKHDAWVSKIEALVRNTFCSPSFRSYTHIIVTTTHDLLSPHYPPYIATSVPTPPPR